MKPLLFLSLVPIVICCLACGGVVSQGELVNTEESQDGLLDRGPFPWRGESMGYSVRHAGTGAELMQVNVAVGQLATADDGTQTIPITGSAVSVALARMFARVDDYSDTFIDPKTWLPIYATKDLKENDRHRTYHVWFWPEELYATAEKHVGKNVHKYNVPLPCDTRAAMTWVDQLVFRAIKEASQQARFIYDGWKLSRLTVVVQEKEEIWTPIGFYSAYRMDVYREKFDSFWPQGALSGVLADPQLVLTDEKAFLGNAWVADDEFHTPIRLAIGTKLGDLDLIINQYTPPSPETLNE